MNEMHTKLRLDPYRAVALEDARGRMVTCIAGIAWLTMEGDSRDIVLAPGESFMVERDGLTLIASQQASTVTLSRARARRNWWQRLAEAMARVYGPKAVRADRNWVY